MNKIELPISSKKLTDEQIINISKGLRTGKITLNVPVYNDGIFEECKEVMIIEKKYRYISEIRKLIDEKRKELKNANYIERREILLQINNYMNKIEELKKSLTFSLLDDDSIDTSKKNLRFLSRLSYTKQ